MISARSAASAAADERIHPPYKIATLVQAAAAEGLGAGALLVGTGLTSAALADAEVRTSSRQFALACANAIALGASPELPFRMGMQVRVSHYGLYGYALLTCRTVREGLGFDQCQVAAVTNVGTGSIAATAGSRFAGWTGCDSVGGAGGGSAVLGGGALVVSWAIGASLGCGGGLPKVGAAAFLAIASNSTITGSGSIGGGLPKKSRLRIAAPSTKTCTIADTMAGVRISRLEG